MNPKRTLFFDIETIKSKKAPSRDEIKVPGNITKPETIEKYINENLQEIWEKTALQSLKAQIICIGYAFDDEPVQVITGTEEEIIKKFEEVIMEGPFLDWVGQNILSFDLPFIYHRAIKYGCKALRNVTPNQKFAKNVFDTMTMFAGTNYQSYHSLNDIAEYLGLPNHKKDMNGNMVGKFYEEGKMEEIKEYCKQDVELERMVYYALTR
jgi:predicted PolB exonuclease-like 3'-5' exonuclease